MNLLTKLNSTNPTCKMTLAIALVGLIGLCDYLTGYEVSFSIFYVIPVYYIAWELPLGFGLGVALVSGFTWLCIDLANDSYSNVLIPFWNGMVRLAYFLLVAWLSSRLKTTLQREQRLARQDNLTGAANARSFYELLQIELDRSHRYRTSLTIVYIDLDNFKLVNDQFGHSTGDQVLQIVVDYLRNNLRKIDVIARLGGDEFALLMPDATMASAEVTLSRIKIGLLEEMKIHQWPVSFSMGALSYDGDGASAQELVKIADHIMYEVKQTGKNSIKYQAYSGE